MATLCVIGPGNRYVTCEMLKNVNMVINLYVENFNIKTIITTNENGVAAQARHYARKYCLCLEEFNADNYSNIFNLYKTMIKRSNFLLIFTFNGNRRTVRDAAQYAGNHNVNANVLPLIF